MKKYVSPKIEFNSLNLREDIADTCWGHQANKKGSPTFYYDVKVEGYISFTLGYTGSCDSPNAQNILYYSYKGEAASDGSKYEYEVESALIAGGGNAGQNYKGMSFTFPEKPSETWS